MQKSSNRISTSESMLVQSYITRMTAAFKAMKIRAKDIKVTWNRHTGDVELCWIGRRIKLFKHQSYLQSLRNCTLWLEAARAINEEGEDLASILRA